MPNHITNHVAIKGSKEKIAELIKKTKLKLNNKSEKNQFDFNGIIKMPETSDTFYGADAGGLGSEEREKYGENNWYDWSITNWGTEWNCYEVRYTGGDETTIVIEFQTAWSPPTPIFDELERQGYSVNCYWQDEYPSNEGEYGNPYDVFDIDHTVTVEYLG